MPRISPGETDITLYTSGSTGKPKAVRQRLAELENDNRFVLSQWGGEIARRKACSTVSHHHIYGLLFAALLPFTAGIPFRRSRIAYPEELETLTDVSYLIVTVPAFLKRAAETRTAPLPLKSPWIFSSGGALPRETAEKTERLFGFWPLEVYGSTETSGIAYRISKQGAPWTPFAGADVSLNDEGRLVVRSPYIQDPAGFATGDRAEILPDRRFILKERADSVVKIEEKRVSLPEVEQRILSSGLVKEAAVLALESRRQFLGAAAVLNEAGKERFAGLEKREIHRYFTEYLGMFLEKEGIPRKWRWLESLPANEQGKKKRDEIAALFEPPEEGRPEGAPFARLEGKETVREKTGTSAALELTVSGDCGYFDGHFPGFKLLSGAAQIDLALRFGARYLGTGLFVSHAKRIKFSRIITPGAAIRLELSFREGTLAFRITSPDRSAVYSAGNLTLGDGR
jgi:acyl-coenzyme A synthetase/AMP-(fatty) acid ligase/3-hydroxymyristoyl/3-hydroxydecanoyl-(acyl carrier protein) dehydratase